MGNYDDIISLPRHQSSGTQINRTKADGTLTKHRYANRVRGASMA